MTLILSGTNGVSDIDGSAATPAIRGTDANTGIFFPAADTIAFSEGGVESMRLDSSANLQFNSGYGSVATAYGCRAWVNFNGTGTVAIRASGNVTSITDNGTGNYTVNFTTALPDTSYSPQVRAALINYNIAQAGNTAQSVLTTSYNPGTFYINGSNSSYNFNAGDPTDVYIAIFR
jgi:hypothetical protein